MIYFVRPPSLSIHSVLSKIDMDTFKMYLHKIQCYQNDPQDKFSAHVDCTVASTTLIEKHKGMLTTRFADSGTKRLHLIKTLRRCISLCFYID